MKIILRKPLKAYEFLEIEVESISEAKDVYDQVEAIFGTFEDKQTSINYEKVTCGLCGSDTYDNRNNKKFEKAPDYKCKKCSAVKWVSSDKWYPPKEK